MDLLVDRAAGLDVHKRSVVACIRTPGEDRSRVERVRRFGTTIPDLMELQTWLGEQLVTHVAMESTGVLWIPVWDMIEPLGIEQLLVNPRYVRMLPGEKTDKQDARWLCQLVEVGMLRSSFVPPREIRDLRDLTRTRRREVQARTRVHQRIDKVLETAGIKLSSVASDTLGVSSQRMIRALIAGERDADVLAEMALGKLKDKIPELRKALQHRFRSHHAFQLAELLDKYHDHSARIVRLEQKIAEACEPYADWLERTMTLPGVGVIAAQSFLAEVGPDISQWSSPQRFCRWAGVAPGNNETGGNRKPAATGKTNTFLADTIRQAALSASKTNGSLFEQRKRHLKNHGKSNAVALTAVSHSLMIAFWHMHTRRQPYCPSPAKD
jgi:transposase